MTWAVGTIIPECLLPLTRAQFHDVQAQMEQISDECIIRLHGGNEATVSIASSLWMMFWGGSESFKCCPIADGRTGSGPL